MYHIRSSREIIEKLIAAREVELAKRTAAEQRRRVERDLIFLRDELARIEARGAKHTVGCKRPGVAIK